MPDAPPTWRDRLASVPLEPSRLFLAGLVALALVVGAVMTVVVLGGLGGSPPAPQLTLPRAVPATRSPAGAAGTGASSEGAGEVYVHAAGAVARPGVYRVRAGGRVSDLLDAAGGPAPDADLDQLNLAAKLSDGERVLVPRRGEVLPVPASGPGGQPGAAGWVGPLDVNTATAEQLETLPGVGPATAQAILDHRREHGRFRSVDELLDVRGIGEAKLAALRSKVRV